MDVDTILDEYNVRQPDNLFFAKGCLHLIGDKAMEDPPDLALEVISPSSIVEIDRTDKFAQYAVAGVAYYWIIDPQQKTMEGWELRDGRYEPTGRAQASGTVRLSPFKELDIAIKRLWRN